MSFEIKPRGRIGPALQALAQGELTRILQTFGSLDPENLAHGTHDARKRLKKLRALVSLLREPLGKKRCREEKATLRNAGRALGSLRDLQAQLSTLEQLRLRFFSDKSPALLRTVRQNFLAKEQRAATAFFRSDTPVKIIALVQAELEAVAAWPVEEYAWKDLRRAVKHGYQRARESYQKAHDAPIGDRLHSWRKRTKELWTHLRLLRKISPLLMEELTQDYAVLGEFLGDDRNLLLLRSALEDSADESTDRHVLETFLELIDIRRGELLDAAFDLADRLFAETPTEFINLLDSRRTAKHERAREAKKLAAQLTDED